MRIVGDRSAFAQNAEKLDHADVNGMLQGHDVLLGEDVAQMLDGARAADAAVADERRGEGDLWVRVKPRKTALFTSLLTVR